MVVRVGVNWFFLIRVIVLMNDFGRVEWFVKSEWNIILFVIKGESFEKVCISWVVNFLLLKLIFLIMVFLLVLNGWSLFWLGGSM